MADYAFELEEAMRESDPTQIHDDWEATK